MRSIDQGIVVDLKLFHQATLKIINKDHEDHYFDIQVSGLPGIKIKNTDPVLVRGSQVEEALVDVLVDPAVMKSPSVDILFRVTATEKPELTADSVARFLKPLR